MLSTVPVDDAIRTVSVEMSKEKGHSFIGKTEAEMEVLAHYAEKGRRRAAMGAIVGSSIMGGLWKISKNQKKLAGAFAILSGGLFGASYGIISIRRNLFSDLLMLPSEKSPFAARARTILMTKIPENSFVQELNEKFNSSMAATDSWNEDTEALGNFGSKQPSMSLPSVPRRFDNGISSRTPPIIGLDTPRHEKEARDEAFGKPNNNGSRSPFVFGAKPLTDDTSDTKDSNTPLSRAPFPQSRQESHQSKPDEDSTSLRHDEDDYFFDDVGDAEPSVKPTTWEEIRRRAAERCK
ncbi:unnamed protein product [Peronospora farinosa]|uniref:Transmembrane protein n=1 Tax=Peronospora farinosa TaxID=134698 RepID=A0AAV0TPG1_9STRA|nr:unnamed protein product [Peronospora farinosa]CAI5725323.1 unnamed protein product [Peronospora farinosa]